MKSRTTIINKRRKLGLTQQQLADQIGVSVSVIAQWETSDHNEIKEPFRSRLVEVLNVHPIELEDMDNIEPAEFVDIPVIKYHLMGDDPLDDDNVIDFIQQPMQVVPDETVFAVCAGDDTMEPTFKAGMFVLFQQYTSIVDDDVVAAKVNGEVVLRRFQRLDDQVVLFADNEEYDPIKLDDCLDGAILGRGLCAVKYLLNH